MSAVHIIVACVLIISLLGGPLLLVLRQRARRREAWRAIGDELNLELDAKEPIVTGRYHDRLITAGIMSVDGSPMGGGQSATTLVRVSLPETSTSSYELLLRRESLTAKLGKLMGGEDIELGDTAFDKRYIVTTSSPEMTISLLTAEIRSALMGLERSLSQGHISVKNNMVWWETPLIVTKADEVRVVLDLLIEIAQGLATLRPANRGVSTPS